MPNASEPERGETEPTDETAGEQSANPDDDGDEDTAGNPAIPSDAATQAIAITQPGPDSDPEAANPEGQHERRFTAPGFDARETQIIAATPAAATEAFPTQPALASPPPSADMPPRIAFPQAIPSRTGAKPQTFSHRNWGWALAVVVIVLALAAIAIVGTMLLTRSKPPRVSQEDQVRHTIQHFDIAIQTGNLTALRSITCGTTRDGYVEYDERAWAETYRQVSAARQYPVIASIDQIVVNGRHAEANITTFMAYDPQVRSTRSLDLQFRDDQWKICQSPSN
ncbi:hypothetical protein [Mycobacterium sp.]|uniref:Rv0361 family membrane protein n=1 Tax=Mycobacterium sp. TaxID=1785 RepID=UPI003BAA54F0